MEIEHEAVDRLASEAGEGRPVVLTRDGEPVAAVVGITMLRRLTDERDLLRRLALGELESAAGEGHSLDAVLEECRLLLEEN
jgi:prevent-host-death family protein